MKLKTKRLILHTLRPEDVTQDYADWLNDLEVNKFLSCPKSGHTIKSCKKYVESYEEFNPLKNSSTLIGIFLTKIVQHKIYLLHIGNITISYVDWKEMIATIGICVGRKKLWRQGYATEALTAIVKYLIDILGFKTIKAGVYVRNIKSVELFQKCGFEMESYILTKGKND